MAVLRDRPYAQFNFLVDLGTGVTEGPQAGFQECGPIGMSVDVREYRTASPIVWDTRITAEAGVRLRAPLAR